MNPLSDNLKSNADIQKPWLLYIDAEVLATTKRLVDEVRLSLAATDRPDWVFADGGYSLLMPAAVPSLGPGYETQIRLHKSGCELTVYATDERGGDEIPFGLSGQTPTAEVVASPSKRALTVFESWLGGLEPAVNENSNTRNRELLATTETLALSLGMQSNLDWAHCSIHTHLYGLHEVRIGVRGPGPDLIYRTREQPRDDGFISDALVRELDRLVDKQCCVQLEFLHYSGELPQLSIGSGLDVYVKRRDDIMAGMRAIAANSLGTWIERD